MAFCTKIAAELGIDIDFKKYREIEVK